MVCCNLIKWVRQMSGWPGLEALRPLSPLPCADALCPELLVHCEAWRSAFGTSISLPLSPRRRCWCWTEAVLSSPIAWLHYEICFSAKQQPPAAP